MKKLTGLLTILITLILMSQMVYAVEESDFTYDWLDFISFNSFQFTNENLSLPEDGFKDFSAEGHEELLDMATQFGDINNNTVTEDGEEKELEIARIQPLPGVEVNADYGQLEDDLQIEKWTNINLEYKVNNNTKIYAGYGLESKESVDIIPLSYNTEPQPGDNTELNDQSQIIHNKEKSQKKQLGIAYQSSENLIISADYIEDDIETNDNGNSTIFGIKYIDDKGQLKASYQVDNGEEGKGTITGVELALPDIATLSASYKLLNPEFIQARLNKESVWDFGLDVNLSEVSSLSIGYQLKKNNEEEESQAQESEESKFQASFKIDF